MKHLIAFLGYNLSRIQHPVYRQFIQAPIARRNASLLFQARPLEERELVHEVNELRRRDSANSEITFHICATLDDPLMGQQVIQTVSMIRRLYDCPSYVYCLIPNLDTCTEEQRKAAWKSLVSINNGVTDYPSLLLMSHCFLYHDETQVSLADFLYDITRQPEALDELERNGYLGKLVRERRSGDITYIPEFPSVFSTFNAKNISYPEDDVRYFIHQNYLEGLLALSRPETNAVSMEQCNVHVDEILSMLPLSEEKITITSESFIDLPQETNNHWQEIESYWKEHFDKATKELEDLPHELWVQQLYNVLDVLYNSRFRDMGVEYFYAKHRKKTSLYCDVMMSTLREGLRNTMFNNAYPPETSKDIVRSIVNHLQQEVIGFNTQATSLADEINKLETSLNSLVRTYDSMGFFDRMRGKDKALFEEIKGKILRHYIAKTRHSGLEFAIKLLNEFIPQVSALAENADHLAQLCQEAINNLHRYIDGNSPRQMMSIFPAEPIQETAEAVRQDKSQLLKDYRVLIELLYAENPPVDGELLLQQLRDLLNEEIDDYILQRIKSHSLPPILNVNIIDRLNTLYEDKGGIRAFVSELKNKTALSLKLKKEGSRNEQYLLLAPDGNGVGPHVSTTEESGLQMLHILTGISLADLEGFAGQRMFVEPSIF